MVLPEMFLQTVDSIRSGVWARGGRFWGACEIRSEVVMLTAEDEAKKASLQVSD